MGLELTVFNFFLDSTFSAHLLLSSLCSICFVFNKLLLPLIRERCVIAQ